MEEIKVGDLVRILGVHKLGRPLGIVTGIKTLTHDPSGEQYTAVTAVVGGKYFTFGSNSFELISSTERKKK